MLDLPEIKRKFHQRPETCWTEFWTTSELCSYLESFGFKLMIGKEIIIKHLRENLPDTTTIENSYQNAIDLGANLKYLEKMKGGFTGVMGKLNTGKPGPLIAFRSDIDALPITESKKNEHRPVREGWRSKNEGRMHACGHDVHMTIGLGIAEYLAKNKDSLNGSFLMIFSPAEEGGKGCVSISKLPIISKIKYLFAYHILNMGLNGASFIAPNIIFRYVEIFHVEFTSKGKLTEINKDLEKSSEPESSTSFVQENKDKLISEIIYEKVKATASKPYKGDNSLLAGCSAILNIKSIPRLPNGYSRISMVNFYSGNQNTKRPFTIFKGADPFGFTLIIRADSDEIGEYMKEKAIHLLETSAKLYNVKVGISKINKYSYPAWHSNDPYLIQLATKTWKEMGMGNNLVNYPYGELGSDDCIYLMKNVLHYNGKPIYMGLISDDNGGRYKDLHTNRFDINDSIMQMGVNLMVKSIHTLLNQYEK